MTEHALPTSEAYAADPTRCPFCGGDKLLGSKPHYTADPRRVHATMTCDGCGKEYNEVYTLTGWTQ